MWKSLKQGQALKHCGLCCSMILLDVNMPEMDGFELAEIVRSTNNTHHVPIVFVSASVHDPDHRKKGYESGAVDFI